VADVPKGAYAKKSCGCVVIAEWFDSSHQDESEQRKSWARFRAKAKRCGYAVTSFNEKPTDDWLCGPHRAAREAYKAALTAMEGAANGATDNDAD
jgi:hypothetical protein